MSETELVPHGGRAAVRAAERRGLPARCVGAVRASRSAFDLFDEVHRRCGRTWRARPPRWVRAHWWNQWWMPWSGP